MIFGVALDVGLWLVAYAVGLELPWCIAGAIVSFQLSGMFEGLRRLDGRLADVERKIPPPRDLAVIEETLRGMHACLGFIAAGKKPPWSAFVGLAPTREDETP